METWLHIGESTPFSELLPPDCTFLSSPRTTGKGGGLACVFKSSLHCQQIPSVTYFSFELQLYKQNSSPPLLCAVVYRPPKHNKYCIQDFENFLFYGGFLISGDLNIHVCCVIVLVFLITSLFYLLLLSPALLLLLVHLHAVFVLQIHFLPLLIKRPNVFSEPWINDPIRALRRSCRRAERRWKKDKLHVSFRIPWDCLLEYQKVVKAAKTAYISHLVSNNIAKPKVLFNVLDSLVNP